MKFQYVHGELHHAPRRSDLRTLARISITVCLFSGLISAAPTQTAPADEVIVRFEPGTIADPGPAQRGRAWALEDFDARFSPLLDKLRAAGVQELRPLGLSWRNGNGMAMDIHGRFVDVVDFSTVYVAKMKPGRAPGMIARGLATLPAVEAADVPGQAEFFSPYLGTQWWMENTGATTVSCGSEVLDGQADVDMNVPEAWSVQSASDALVGILDTGVYTNGSALPQNADLRFVYNSQLSRDFTGAGMDDYAGHGTRIAGIVAGDSGHGSDFEGIVGRTSGSGWNPLVALRIGITSPNAVHVIEAIDYLLDPSKPAFGKVTVISNSWGSHSPSSALSDAFANAYAQDIAIFAASGNGAGPPTYPYPAAFLDYTASVAHVLADGSRLSYYSGPYIDVAAPGGSHITTTGETSLDNCFGGTSSSCPMAAGVASLMRGLESTLTNDDIYALLELTAKDWGDYGYDEYFGHGLIRADKALQAIDEADGGGLSARVKVLNVPTRSSPTYLGETTMVFRNISFPLNLRHQTGRVYEVEAHFNLPGRSAKSITHVWTRNRDCQTVRGPEDLYHLDELEYNYPYFDGERLGNWAEVEHVAGSTYAVRGFTYEVLEGGVSQGWYPFNPYIAPGPHFRVAYLEKP